MKVSKTLLLGASGLVGQAFRRSIGERQNISLLIPSHTELDLTEQEAVLKYFLKGSSRWHKVENTIL